MEKLIIRILQNGNLQWALFLNGQEILHEEPVVPEQLRPIIPSAKSERTIIALVPGQDVVLRSIEVPPGQRRALYKVLPFLVEEQLAEEINDLHIVAGGIDEYGMTQVAVVRRAHMTHWLQLLDFAGIAPDLMLPETLSLPLQKESWSLLCSGDISWIRTGLHSAAAIENAMLIPLIELYSQQDIKQPSGLNIMNGEMQGTDIARSAGDLLIRLYPEVQINCLADIITPLSAFCLGYKDYTETSELNLLHGSFATKSSGNKLHKNWRIFAAIVASFFFVQMAIEFGETTYLFLKSSAAQKQSLALYKQLFPNDEKIVNPLQQMKSHLNGNNQLPDRGFLTFMSHISRHWSGTENTTSLQIQAIDFKDAPPKLTLNISTTDIVAVNKLVQRLDSDGIHAKLISVVNDKEGVKGQLSLEEGAK